VNFVMSMYAKNGKMAINHTDSDDRLFTLRDLAGESFIARRLICMNDAKRCELCHREVGFLTQHHLIPRTTHKRKKRREGFTQEELNRVIWICAPCHKNIHAVLTEKELAEDFNTIEKLLAFPAIAKFTAWVRKQADAPIRVRSSNEKQERKKANKKGVYNG
jgi:hypothetical protein